MTLIAVPQLRAFAPTCDAALIAPALDAAAVKFGIDTPRELRHWLAHMHHESAGFTRLSENLNYSAKRLTEVWPKRFPTLAAAAPYANNPKGLANKVYGGRMGNTGPNDGWLYRGGGFMELTGKANYAEGEKWSGLPLVASPDLIRTPAGAAMTAAGFWAAHGLNQLVAADANEKIYATIGLAVRLNEEDDLQAGREVVNGGLLGLDDVRTQLLRAASIWGA